MAQASEEGNPDPAQPLPAVSTAENPDSRAAPFGHSKLPNGEGVGGSARTGPATLPVTPHTMGGAELPLSDGVFGEGDGTGPEAGSGATRDPDLETSDDDIA